MRARRISQADGEAVAEAHGNRTHPPSRNRPGTTVLKTAGGTSPLALPHLLFCDDTAFIEHAGDEPRQRGAGATAADDATRWGREIFASCPSLMAAMSDRSRAVAR